MPVIPILIVATLATAVGETLLSVGMKRLGRQDGPGMVLSALTNPYVLVGTSLMAVYFGLYSFALSKARVSFASPFTALSYLFIALLARFLLKEPVSALRWTGVLLIMGGIVLVGLSQRS